MDEEDDAGEMIPPQQGMPHAFRATALAMTGEFVLILGILFFLLGLGAFITDYLRIKGSGEALVGIFLCGVALLFFFMSGRSMRRQAAKGAAPGPLEKKGKVDDSGSYR